MLLRYPALLVAVVTGTALLALAAAAFPLFLSATSSEIVAGSIARPHITRYLAGMTYRVEHLPLDPVRIGFGLQRRDTPTAEQLGTAFEDLAAGSPILAQPLPAVVGDEIVLSAGDPLDIQPGRLFAEPGVLDHVERVSGTDGDGVWIPRFIAADLELGPGDEIDLSHVSAGGETHTVQVPVDGVYEDIYYTWPSDGYWLQWRSEFRLLDILLPPPPQPILADRDQVLELARKLGQRSATLSWQATIRHPSDVSLEDMQALNRYVPSTQPFSFNASEGVMPDLWCCGTWGSDVAETLTTFGSSTGLVVADAERRIATIRGPTEVLELAALAIALVVVAAAGVFSMRARRSEAAWLHARGFSPLTITGKSALEVLLPAVAAGVLGALVAASIVWSIGPDGTIDGSAYTDAVIRVALAVVGAVTVTAAVAGRAYARIVDPHGRRLSRIVAALPWELGIVALGVLAWRRLDSGGAFVTDERLGVDVPSLALVAFPFLTLAGLAFLAARLAHLGFRSLRRPTARATPPLYLATRRLATDAALAVALIGAAGLCLGMFVHAEIVSSSLRTTVTAKARAYVGADVAAQIAYVSQAPDGFPYPITRVVQVAGAIRVPSGATLDLLAIDPDSFARTAYWNEAFGAPSLAALMPALEDGDGGRLPIIVAAGDGLSVDRIDVGGGTVPVDVAARVDAFPGLLSRRPLVVVDERALLQRLQVDPFVHGWAELWARGRPDRILHALAETEIPTYVTITAPQVEDIPSISATLDTFTIVNVLGTIAATLTLVAMVLYVRARQRSEVVSFALSTRMGMTEGQHRAALALELGAMVGTGFLVGTALAIWAARVTVPLLDPITQIPPGPLFLVPVRWILFAAIALGLLTWIGAAIVDRRARAIDLAEVMRVAE